MRSCPWCAMKRSTLRLPNVAEATEPGIHFRPLFRLELAVAARKGHPLARATSLSDLAASAVAVLLSAGVRRRSGARFRRGRSVIAQRGGALRIVYHGLDADRADRPSRPGPARNNRAADGAPVHPAHPCPREHPAPPNWNLHAGRHPSVADGGAHDAGPGRAWRGRARSDRSVAARVSATSDWRSRSCRRWSPPDAPSRPHHARRVRCCAVGGPAHD